VGHEAAGGNVADKAELAPPIHKQGSDPQYGEMTSLSPSLGRLGCRARKGEGRLLESSFQRHSFISYTAFKCRNSINSQSFLGKKTFKKSL
jgi:hypothetical protein